MIIIWVFMQEERLMAVFWKSAVSTFRVIELCPDRRCSDLGKELQWLQRMWPTDMTNKHPHTQTVFHIQ